jgi:hypothetical protein
LIPSEYAERSLRAANSLLPIAAQRERWSWRVWRRLTNRTDQLRLELAVPRAVAAAEDFLLMRAAEHLHPTLLEPIAPTTPDPLGDRLRSAARRFSTLLEVCRIDLGVDVTTLKDWDAFSKWRQLRHVLVHRLGYWQPGLDPQPLLRARIASLGENPEVYRGQVPLASRDLVDAVANANALVADADAKFP